MEKDESSFDVIVVGGGCAGLVAALAAKVNGARVLLLEKTATLGGTLAWSGGAIWAPLNRHQQAAGISDSSEQVGRYMSSESENRYPKSIAAHISSAPLLIDFLEQHTDLQFEVGTVPDYHAEIEGAVGALSAPGGTFESRSPGQCRLILMRLMASNLCCGARQSVVCLWAFRH